MSYRCYTQNVLSGYQTGIELYLLNVERKYHDGYNVLHVGAGHDMNGIVDRCGSPERVHGVDIDRGAISRYPGVAWHTSAERMPFSNDSFELVVSEYVLEHLENPSNVFREIERVLAPGGSFISLAPNFYSYKSLVAHFTPLSFHKMAVKFLRGGEGREDEDVYPTEYKANTLPDIVQLAGAQKLTVESIDWANNGPTWFQRIPVLFEFGRLLHALFNYEIFARMRCNMIVVLRKNGPHQLEKKGASSKVEIQCVDCKNSPMQKSSDGYLCKFCGRKYPLSGSLYDVMS